MGFARIMGWFSIALLGGIAAIAGQHLWVDAHSPKTAVQAVSSNSAAHTTDGQAGPVANQRKPAPVIHPDAARRLVLECLGAVGLRTQSIHQGSYPLRGAGRAVGDTMPLISFTCPVAHPCKTVLAGIERRLITAGLSLVSPRNADRARRPIFRAVAKGPNPILAIRAYPPGPRLTVLVTEVGVEPATLDSMLALDEDVTYAISANGPYATDTARRLTTSGREFIAHLPMEPKESQEPDGPNFLTLEMTTAEIGRQTRKLLSRVPGAVGADGHLGGRFTSSSKHVGAVLEVLAENGLFFLDQRASDVSVATAAAKAIGVRTAIRTHRIESGNGSIEAKLRAVEVALVLEGHAVVVAGPSLDVLKALRTWLSGLRKRKIHLIRLSEIVL